jgi:hypothetical protein
MVSAMTLFKAPFRNLPESTEGNTRKPSASIVVSWRKFERYSRIIKNNKAHDAVASITEYFNDISVV